MSVPMIATKPFVYAGKRLKAGDPFPARGESDARVLEAVQNARRDAQVPKAITDPVPAAQAPKRGRGYRKQSLEAQAATGTDLDSSRQGASEPQGSEEGTAEKPEAGTLETAPAAAAEAPPQTRRRYGRRDLAGAPE